MNAYLDISPEVREALAGGKPIVALESTIISHGMPYPQNVETALTCQRICRENGAVPATCAILGGKLCAGLTDAQIDNYFEELRTDLSAACYGMLFLELADYYTIENNEDKPLLKLLYQSLRALSVKSIDKKLVRIIYELKALMVEGEYPGLDVAEHELDPSTVYSVHFIETAPVEKLYTFAVSEHVLEELDRFALRLRRRFINRPLKSLQMLETVEA